MATTRRDLIKARFAATRRELDRIVARITPDLLDWAPAHGMRTVSGQLAEILSIEIPLLPALIDGAELSTETVDGRIGDCSSLENLKAKLAAVRQETLSYLDTLSDADLAEEVAYGGPWFGSVWLPTLPRAELFLNVAEHELYHVGQLTSYLWFRGDDPYKWYVRRERAAAS